MPTLYVLSGPEIGRQIEVGDGAVLGRADDCDAVLRHLSVSRRHARVELKRAGWRVVDLGSRNGLFLNGERVKKLFVEDGTEFRLGDLELRLRFAPGEPTDATETAEPAADLPSGLEDTLVREAPELAPEVIEDDFEFADETPVAAPAPRAAASEELALEDPDEITLEEPDEIELEDAPRSHAAAPAAPVAPPARSAPRPAAPPARPSAAARAGIAPAAQPGGAQDPARKALQYHRVETRGGFLSADLAQYPAWVRLAAVFVALVLFAGLFVLAFRAAGAM